MKFFAAAVCLLILVAGEAAACGYCVEDKIAAVYDHAALQQAKARRQAVVYFAIDGAIRDSAKALEKMAESAPGVQNGSVRVSVEAAALAVVFDPARTPLAALQRGLEQKLKGRGLELLLLDSR